MRVPPKLMAHVRDSARTYGKSGPIDALAVARAAQREPDLPVVNTVAARIQNLDGTVARLARGLVDRSRELTLQIKDLTTEITVLVSSMAPALIAVPGCGAITAAKILGETAGVDRFRSKDAFARHNGTAPMPV